MARLSSAGEVITRAHRTGAAIRRDMSRSTMTSTLLAIALVVVCKLTAHGVAARPLVQDDPSSVPREQGAAAAFKGGHMLHNHLNGFAAEVEAVESNADANADADADELIAAATNARKPLNWFGGGGAGAGAGSDEGAEGAEDAAGEEAEAGEEGTVEEGGEEGAEEGGAGDAEEGAAEGAGEDAGEGGEGSEEGEAGAGGDADEGGDAEASEEEEATPSTEFKSHDHTDLYTVKRDRDRAWEQAKRAGSVGTGEGAGAGAGGVIRKSAPSARRSTGRGTNIEYGQWAGAYTRSLFSST